MSNGPQNAKNAMSKSPKHSFRIFYVPKHLHKTHSTLRVLEEKGRNMSPAPTSAVRIVLDVQSPVSAATPAKRQQGIVGLRNTGSVFPGKNTGNTTMFFPVLLMVFSGSLFPQLKPKQQDLRRLRVLKLGCGGWLYIHGFLEEVLRSFHRFGVNRTVNRSSCFHDKNNCHILPIHVVSPKKTIIDQHMLSPLLYHPM